MDYKLKVVHKLVESEIQTQMYLYISLMFLTLNVFCFAIMDSEIQTQRYLYISFTVSTFKFVLSRHH